jgi:hypothetical protein
VTYELLSCKHNAYVVVHISIARGAEPNMPSHNTRSLPRAPLLFGLVLRTVDIPEKLDGLRMELEDGAYPALASVTVCVSELEKAFKGCDVFVATGGFPRQKGMERKDLIAKNAPIFAEQGAAIEEFASKDIKVCVCVCVCVRGGAQHALHQSAWPHVLPWPRERHRSPRSTRLPHAVAFDDRMLKAAPRCRCNTRSL